MSLQLNKGRKVTGVLRGYDQFMNIVLDGAIEEIGSTTNNIGMVVRFNLLLVRLYILIIFLFHIGYTR